MVKITIPPKFGLPRNCYLKDGDLIPFDVILCRPDEELDVFLRLYD